MLRMLWVSETDATSGIWGARVPRLGSVGADVSEETGLGDGVLSGDVRGDIGKARLKVQDATFSQSWLLTHRAERTYLQGSGGREEDGEEADHGRGWT